MQYHNEMDTDQLGTQLKAATSYLSRHVWAPHVSTSTFHIHIQRRTRQDRGQDKNVGRESKHVAQ